MNKIYYNLFLRNWKNNVATVENIDQAVAMGYITDKQGEEIKKLER